MTVLEAYSKDCKMSMVNIQFPWCFQSLFFSFINQIVINFNNKSDDTLNTFGVILSGHVFVNPHVLKMWLKVIIFRILVAMNTIATSLLPPPLLTKEERKNIVESTLL